MALVALLGVAALFAFYVVKSQGVSKGSWDDYALAKVRFDDQGIPTIEGKDWLTVSEAQGYVVASDRLWHMDLVRRKSGGRLAEWFGDKAYEMDVAAQMEDRIGLTQRAHAALPPAERRYCDAYAKGVNAYIKDHQDDWGLEYTLLGAKPEPWTCADSLLVLLEMAGILSVSAADEAQQSVWKHALPEEWRALLYPTAHPWNKPLFLPSLDTVEHGMPQLPPEAAYLPARPISPEDTAAVTTTDKDAVGSNNWAYRGSAGHFLANDTHLGNGVPGVWYAIRLRLSSSAWVVGATIPGLPGIVLGMNPHVAWAFTNVGEDVDDYLLESISADGQQYLAAQGAEGDDWRPIEYKTFEIKVRGEAEPRVVKAAFTHRGPLANRRWLGDGLYSRQWLPLKDGILRLPTIDLMNVTDLEGVDRAIDEMRTPAQNVVAMDRAGNISYRVSGTGVRRRVSGRTPQPALVGEWLGFEPMSERRRKRLPATEGLTAHLGTANERNWVDAYGHVFYNDDRRARIDEVLGARGDLTQADMEALHLDSVGRFRRELLLWVVSRWSGGTGRAAELAEAWNKWDGSARSDPLSARRASLVEALMAELFLGRVARAHLSEEQRKTPYSWSLKRAWLVKIISEPGDAGVAPFGLTAAEVASYVMNKMAEANVVEPHQLVNRWKGQHPFATRLPVIGRLFKIEEFPQWGAHDLVNAEQPTFGPSMRMVWNLSSPQDSTWIFPIGQSGHAGTEHYDDLHAFWRDNVRFKVFTPDFEWVF